MGKPERRIRVLLVDDSALYRAFLRELLSDCPDIEIAGEAVNGKEAIARARELGPDLIVMDVVMPVMDGLTAVKAILAEHPIPILVLTSASGRAEPAVEALVAGALDVMPKPEAGDRASLEALEDELPHKIRALSRIRVVTRTARNERPSSDPPPVRKQRLFLIGSSTGGPQAMSAVLGRLPRNFPAPVLVVQHIAHGFLEGLIDWLSRECKLPIEVATDGGKVLPGKVYFAPTRRHLELQGPGLTRLVDTPPVNGCKPSVDVLFQSAADLGASVVAVVLTGMGQDGLAGSRALARAGARVLVQTPQSCAVPGMPSAVIDAGEASEVLEPESIGDTMVRLALAAPR